MIHHTSTIATTSPTVVNPSVMTDYGSPTKSSTSPTLVNPSTINSGATTTKSTLIIKGVTPLSRQINRLLWASVGLSLCALGFDLAFLGLMSFWMTPIATFFTLIHNTILLVRIRKESKADPDATADCPPAYEEEATAGVVNPLGLKLKLGTGNLTVATKKGSIVGAWLCMALWLGAWGVVLACFIVTLSGSIWISERLLDVLPAISGIEWVLTLAEVGVLATLAIKCTKERTLIMKEANWYQMQK